ncbi:putative Xaa-Pro aminopeptidase [Lineolata rhizophorae]|uniref:Xaa-Pro aminopeptidase n=1 Tax=Lineolata rhizophorae TaxID=578093 RepID=A0A6A6NUM3_9PEZI|nr:putative Xaa-Pro aminopeptidase [Lineolata rhizophorae]
MAAVEAVPPLGKYPAKEHARKVAGLVVERGGDAKGVVYLEGQKTRMFEDCDQAAGFRQRRPFMYMTGCEVPDCYCTYDMAADKLTLFIPPIDPDDVVWSGLPLTVEEAVEKYDIDNARLSTEVNAYLTSSDHPQSTVYALPDRVSDDVTFLSFAKTDFDLLAGAITTARITKDAYEISLIRYANAATAAGHAAVMRGAATAANEADLEAAFVKECIARQCKKLAYEAIVAGGPHAATLHYVRNDAPLAGKQLVLVDAGAEFGCYAADVTRTMPVSRQGFSAEAWAVYDVVERMQAECVARTLPGARWEAVHEHAHRVAIEGLLALGILRGGSVADILAARTSAAFFPHGLGHYLGMDTHDVGGEADYADPDPMFRYLRVRRELEPGAVITVEPGVYFCRFIVEPYLRDEKHKKYIDEAVLERFWDVGGVRIEDNILITESGNENLTTVPKGAEEVSNIVKGNA